MWSMEGVKEHYLSFEKAGDWYLGRKITMMDCNKASFVTSPLTSLFWFYMLLWLGYQMKCLIGLCRFYGRWWLINPLCLLHFVNMFCIAMLPCRFLKEYSAQGDLFANCKACPFSLETPKTLQQFVCHSCCGVQLIYPKIYRCMFCASNFYLLLEIDYIFCCLLHRYPSSHFFPCWVCLCYKWFENNEDSIDSRTPARDGCKRSWW